MAVKKWTPYLVGRHFKIKTDHQSLKFFLNQKTSTPAQQQWVLKMMGFDYEVVFRKGTSNAVTNALSERSHAELQAITFYQTDLYDRIKATWSTDPFLGQLIKQLQQDKKATLKYTWQNDQLKRRGKLVVGDDYSLRTKLLQHFHCSAGGGHSGAKATMVRLGNALYQKGLKK